MTPEELRAAMPEDAVRICDAIKARFGVKPVYIETATLRLGTDVETDAGWRKYRTKQSIAKYMESQKRV